MENINATDLFLKAVNKNHKFHEVVDIITRNSIGNMWLIGGFVYRNIAHKLYGSKPPETDMDFIIEKPLTNKIFPENWKQNINRYGNPKLIRDDGLEVDFVPLQNVHSINRRGLKPTIKNFLTGTPLTIQSIAYDVKYNKVIGSIGLKALSDKTVGINNIEQADIYAQKKNLSVNALIKAKASDLGFKPVLFKKIS